MIFVKIILFDDNDRVLQHHYLDANKWDIPSGRVEDGETPQAAAVRELKERTGYSTTEESLELLDSFVDSESDMIFVFEASTARKTGEPQTEIRWHTYDV